MFLSANFAFKNTLFNLNENNRIVMAQYRSDICIGVNRICGEARG